MVSEEEEMCRGRTHSSSNLKAMQTSEGKNNKISAIDVLCCDIFEARRGSDDHNGEHHCHGQNDAVIKKTVLQNSPHDRASFFMLD